MRPVQRGIAPQVDDFEDYEDAKPFLIQRLGRYCSYCERRISTVLAVEHIQPKGLNAYQQLVGRWQNFLLACTNCNSSKKDKDVLLADALLPDRDNTFAAFLYTPDGRVVPAPTLEGVSRAQAAKVLELTGLDKAIQATLDENGKQVAIDRVSQRMEAWGIAEDTRNDVLQAPTNVYVRNCAIRTAQETGFFSIWMTVFGHDSEFKNRLVDAFSGTRTSGCFDPITALPISPAPNPDGLPYGGKL